MTQLEEIVGEQKCPCHQQANPWYGYTHILTDVECLLTSCLKNSGFPSKEDLGPWLQGLPADKKPRSEDIDTILEGDLVF